jgi:hypothetical protein
MGDQEKEFQLQHLLETYRSLISISVEGFKAMLLVNGGAVIAFLAFLGSVAPAKPEILPLAAKPLLLFVIGLVISVLAFISSYATQFCLFSESRGRMKEGRHFWPLAIGAVCSLGCVGFFAAGALTSLDVLSAPDKNIVEVISVLAPK